MGNGNKNNSVCTAKLIAFALVGAVAGAFLGVQAYIYNWLG